MTVTYGFYNSVNNDRQYDAVQMSKIFDGIISDGVYSTIGTSLMVTASGGLNVTVGVGRAWFNHTWTYNDSPLVLAITQGDAVLPRVDTIVLEIDANDPVRANRIFVLPGTPNSNPSPAALTNDANKHQYPLAYIAVGVNAQAVLPVNITNKVGTTACPFVTGVITQVTTNVLIAQWEAEFMTWFDEMKDQLSVDAAGNLQLQIDDITDLFDHGVPQVYKRQGGHATNWNLAGLVPTNYDPGGIVRMQAGAALITVAPMGTVGEVVVNFPVQFPSNPMVFLSLVSDTYGINMYALQAPKNDINAGSFKATITMPEAFGPVQRYVEFCWLAIGPQ